MAAKARRDTLPRDSYPGTPGRIRHEKLESHEDPMMVLRWYHPRLTRHAADCMLIDNAPEGSYLLRPATDCEGYVVSIKLSCSVQHIKVAITPDGKYRFGNSSFGTVQSLRRHFELEKPVIGGDSGVTVVLKFPYTRFVEETHMYTEVVHHAVTHMLESSSESDPDILDSERCADVRDYQRTMAVSSKEGYLTKQGRIRKSWRVRWFVLRNQYFSYYKTKQTAKPIAVLNMMRARSVEYDYTKNKDHCFRILFPKRTYYLYANSTEDCQQWIDLLQSKIPLAIPGHK